MNSYYNQDYTEEDITKILETIKECIRNKRAEYRLALKGQCKTAGSSP